MNATTDTLPELAGVGLVSSSIARRADGGPINRRSSPISNPYRVCSAVAGLVILGAPVSPVLAGSVLGAPVLHAAMMPGQPQHLHGGSGGIRLGMMDDKMGMPPPSAGGGTSMAPAQPQGSPPAGGMQGGMMDDKMGMPPQSSAGPAGGMAGMQPPGAPASPSGMAGPGGCMMSMPGMMPMMQMMMQGQASTPLDHVEGRIAFIKAELGITGAQTQAWDEFAQALRTSREHLAEASKASGPYAGGQFEAPKRLEAYEHHLLMRLDALRLARESFQRLYTALTPAQQRSADQLVVPVLASF